MDVEDADVPWGKYSYVLEGLAIRCYLEGAGDTAKANRPGAPTGQKLRFRVELPARCFVLSVAVKLPNAAREVLPALNDVEIERTLSNGEYESVYDGYVVNGLGPEEKAKENERQAREKEAEEAKEDDQGESPKSVELTAAGDGEIKGEKELPRKKVMEVRRAADCLRLTVTDVEEKPTASPLRRRRSSDSEEESDSGDLRTLGIVVVGYVRGQTPAANRIKILLNSSAKLGVHEAMADRAEVDGLLGLAFLSNRRYRQAAELLQRASELVLQVAEKDAKAGVATQDALAWAAELNLVSAHAYFEHMPMSNDGIIRLVQVAAFAKPASGVVGSPRDRRDLTTEFLDLRTELLSMLEGLLTSLVKFLSGSRSPAVKMASAKMIEFVSEQLGCAIARHMSGILNEVLRSYPRCVTFGARERAAAASFSYDSMEDCFERLIDICCRLFPLTEHSVLQNLFDNTLIPVFLDGFKETEYLYHDVDAEEAADELMTTAVAQGLRVIYLVLSILGADARVPTKLITRILNMLVVENENPCTPLLLRRTALHTWDAISKSLRQSALGNTVKAFVDHIKALRDYVPKLLTESPRPGFEYGELEDGSDTEIEIVKEEYLVPENSKELSELLKKRSRRTEIVDRHTLGRLLSLIYDICSALEPSDEEEERYLDVTLTLQETLARSIANLLFSSLIDVSYHEAATSGNGPQENNNLYEFGDINTQLKVAGEVLEELFASYWAVISLLPGRVAAEVVRTAPIRAVLGWCVDRMSHSAPPKGMLKLLFVAVRGLQHELNKAMYSLPSVPPSPHEVTFIALHRAHMNWFPQSMYEESFDLMDMLTESVAEDLMAKDLSQLIQGLGNQAEKFQARTEASLELMATIVASSIPKLPDLALSSLRALVDPSFGKQRIANGFPKSNRSNTGSFTRRMQLASSAPKTDPMSKSLYIHVVLASCFDKFDSLGRAARRRGGPSYMGEKIDAFVEHAALTVRCLHACARARTHREYVGAVLGDIFGTCLAMQDHGDGRVRLAGFEIFAASLDVLFLAQKAMVLVPSQANSSNSEASLLGAGSGSQVPGTVTENPNGVMELSSNSEKDNGNPALVSLVSLYSEGNEFGGSVSAAPSRSDAEKEQSQDEVGAEDAEAIIERQMQTIFGEGGSCSFQIEDTPASRLAFEERGWQMLCSFVNSSLGIGKYVDFVVQRACLEYLKGCMLNALRGRSTGASVIGFEHIEQMWDAVNRLIGSPWRTLNALALWVIIAILNVAIYSSIMARGRGATRQRTAQLNEFLLGQVFPRAEALLKSGIRETRVWGMRLLEAYLRARDLNSHVAQIVPNLPGRVLRGLDNLKHDWDDDVRERSQSLLEIHFSSNTKKSNSSFTQQATQFMTMKRYQNDDPYDNSNSSGIELWFPPLPKQMPSAEMEVYCRTLEAFANAVVEGGEEYDLVGALEERDETEDVYEETYEDEEEGYEFEEGETEEGVENAETEMADETDVVADSLSPDSGEEITSGRDEDAVTDESDDFGGSEGDEQEAMDEKMMSIPKHEPASDEKAGDEPDIEPEVKEGGLFSVDEDVEDEADVDDHEFSSFSSEMTPTSGHTPTLITQVSDNEDDDFGPDVLEVKVGSLEDDDDVEEDEVVDVTDEEDVLVDVESVQSSRKETGTSNEAKRNRIRPSLPALGLNGLNLNPDLDEGVQVLRRKGSFTSRPSIVIPIEEGDAPKLARRRSHDVSSLGTIVDAANEGKLHGREDGDSSLSSNGSPRVGRRKSMKVTTPSPRGAERSSVSSPKVADIAQSRSVDNADSEGSKESRSERDPVDVVGTGTPRLVKRRSLKSLAGKLDENGKDTTSENGRESSIGKTQRDQSKDAVVGGAFLSLSPRGSRIPRGIQLDDEVDDGLQSRPRTSQAQSPSGDSGRGKFSEGRPSASRGNRRSLPRAPAFVKGGSLQRRMSGDLPGLEIKGNDNSGADGPSSTGSGTSSPSLSGTGRSKLPRSRNFLNKSPRPAGLSLDVDTSERKVDRSHRFSKREPLNLSFGDESDEFDKDLLDDLDPSFEVDDDFGNQMRVGTPTAEALKGRNSLADDGPGSGHRRRGSNRNVFNSLHYKGLLDQISTSAPEESPRSEGPGSNRDLKRGGLLPSRKDSTNGPRSASDKKGEAFNEPRSS